MARATVPVEEMICPEMFFSLAKQRDIVQLLHKEIFIN